MPYPGFDKGEGQGTATHRMQNEFEQRPITLNSWTGASGAIEVSNMFGTNAQGKARSCTARQGEKPHAGDAGLRTQASFAGGTWKGVMGALMF